MRIEKIVKPEQTIVSITTDIPVEKLPEIIGPSFMKLAEYIRSESAEIISTPFVSYKNLLEDGQVDGNLVQVEIGFPVNKQIAETAEIKSYTLPSYQAMSTLFHGSYSDLTNPYEEMLAEIKKELGTFTGVSYEYYLTDEEIESDQHQTILEVAYKSNI